MLWLKLLATEVLVIGKFLVTPWIKIMLWLKMTFNHIKYCGWKCKKILWLKVNTFVVHIAHYYRLGRGRTWSWIPHCENLPIPALVASNITLMHITFMIIWIKNKIIIQPKCRGILKILQSTHPNHRSSKVNTLRILVSPSLCFF